MKPNAVSVNMLNVFWLTWGQKHETVNSSQWTSLNRCSEIVFNSIKKTCISQFNVGTLLILPCRDNVGGAVRSNIHQTRRSADTTTHFISSPDHANTHNTIAKYFRFWSKTKIKDSNIKCFEGRIRRTWTNKFIEKMFMILITEIMNVNIDIL